jgi:phage gpG-like protein
MQVSVTITGSDKVVKKLNKLGELNFEPEFIKLGDWLKEYYSGPVFLSSGSVLGAPWAPLSSNYQKYKAKKFTGRGILEKTGTMRKSFQAEATKNSVKITNTADYFKYHQSSAPRTVLPRRIMLGTNAVIKTKIKDLLGEGIKRMVNS